MRFKSWVAVHRIHTAQWWDERTYRYRKQQMRLAWAYWTRRRRAASRLRLGWYGFTHRVGARRQRAADARWARRDRRAARHADRRRRGRARRVPLPVSLGLGGIVMLLALGSVQIVETTSKPFDAVPTDNVDRLASGIVVPDVRGMSASEARAELDRVGLSLQRAIPAVGTPGKVVGTMPRIGRTVTPGTPVMVVVGVEPSRFEAAYQPTLRSPST